MAESEFTFKKIDEMTGREFFCVERLRSDTFVTEQKITLPEEDNDDLKAVQVFKLNKDKTDALATCRIFPLKGRTWQLGRLCVDKELRGQGLGSRIMRAVDQYLKKRGVCEISCHAQVHAKPFYERLGYHSRGPVFDEGGMQHVQMVKKL